VLLKACLNGARRPGDHPALPVTPDQLAADVTRVVAAGAGAVHLHVKDDEGADTLDRDALAAVLSAVRRAAPGVAGGVTTGAWAAPDPAERVARVESWTALPDFASVNWHEEGADDVAAALLGHGVAVEAGLWDADAVDAWAASPHRDRCLRVLLELPDGLDVAATQAEAERLLDRLERHAGSSAVHDGRVLLHGKDSSAWPALRLAARHRLSARIGLEDTLELPDGSPAPDNAALVAAARELVSSG
jgi:uncharacterized protein (DUF849 family)